MSLALQRPNEHSFPAAESFHRAKLTVPSDHIVTTLPPTLRSQAPGSKPSCLRLTPTSNPSQPIHLAVPHAHHTSRSSPFNLPQPTHLATLVYGTVSFPSYCINLKTLHSINFPPRSAVEKKNSITLFREARGTLGKARTINITTFTCATTNTQASRPSEAMA
jgi:hypothetical protein